MKPKRILCTTLLVDGSARFVAELPHASSRWALIRARRAIETGRAARAYICRNTLGPKGRCSSGKVVRYQPEMTTDRHLLEAKHYDNLFIAP